MVTLKCRVRIKVGIVGLGLGVDLSSRGGPQPRPGGQQSGQRDTRCQLLGTGARVSRASMGLLITPTLTLTLSLTLTLILTLTLFLTLTHGRTKKAPVGALKRVH